ncbi:hypothetical protein [Brevibacterium marinum]|uniref:Uncharacterized protein n=1 Tax=Brevibacterium marinum TaxID=418643 RepID=A0A846S263_9MICO|nr:hypothetical protein [Brevibacterium marinum]NJC55662.1 hypothetical protein [Brevibacterium marinum]
MELFKVVGLDADGRTEALIFGTEQIIGIAVGEQFALIVEKLPLDLNENEIVREMVLV